MELNRVKCDLIYKLNSIVKILYEEKCVWLVNRKKNKKIRNIKMIVKK